MTGARRTTSDIIRRERPGAVATPSTPYAAPAAGPRPRLRRILPAFALLACASFVLVPIAGPLSQSFASTADAPDRGAAQNFAAAAEIDSDVARDAYGVTEAPPPPPPPAPVTVTFGAAPAAGTPDPGSAQAIAAQMVADRGWGTGEYDCLYLLWAKESGWNVYAHNASSGAYGIPQALPGSKMATVGADWQTNPRTQITWGLQYIQGRYGTPCGAWAKSQASGWY
jgi:hypothetical protein